MGVHPSSLVGLVQGKSHRSKWMMTGGTPISGNPQLFLKRPATNRARAYLLLASRGCACGKWQFQTWLRVAVDVILHLEKLGKTMINHGIFLTVLLGYQNRILCTVLLGYPWVSAIQFSKQSQMGGTRSGRRSRGVTPGGKVGDTVGIRDQQKVA